MFPTLRGEVFIAPAEFSGRTMRSHQNLGTDIWSQYAIATTNSYSYIIIIIVIDTKAKGSTVFRILMSPEL